MKNSISKSVLAIVVLGILLSGLVIWLGLHKPASAGAVPPVAMKTEPAPAIRPQQAMSAAAAAAAASALKAVSNGPAFLIPVPLAGILTEAENGSWLRDKDYLRAPHAAREFGGIPFLMDGLLQLQGRVSQEWKNRSYRTSIAVPLPADAAGAGRSIGAVHLLGGTRYGSSEEVACAEIVWRYTDGTSARTPVRHLVHVRDWVRNPYEQPARLPYAFSKVVWTAPQPSQPGHHLRLYRTSFANPQPGKILRQLELVSRMEDPTLFVCGLTLDSLKPGARADDSPDLEPVDAVPPKSVQIFVQSAAGDALPQSKVWFQITQRDAGKPVRTSGFIATDAYGSAYVNYAPDGVEQLSVEASHDGYGGRRMMWDLTAGDTIPDSYTLKLGGELRIGGVVVDESDAPVSGAKISLYRYWTGSDDMPDRKGEQANFRSLTVSSDAQGYWEAGGLPTELLDHIGFQVKHPDYLSASANVGGNATTEKQLREGTFKTVLKRGQMVRGKVLDEAGSPVPKAKVWAGRKYSSDRKETSSDAEGKFAFATVNQGEEVFSVAAKGYAVAAKTVNVSSNLEEIVFRLKPGSTLRGHVQDEAGQPLAGARVGLEGRYGESSYDAYEFSANTDSHGDFSWDSAPNETLTFYVFHDGYEAKRDAKLAPDQDNVITLRRARTLSGVVLDAATDQPVTKFTVRTGTEGNNGNDVYGVIRNRSFNSPDGSFSLQLDEEADNAVLVMADGYVDKVEKFPEGRDQNPQVVVRLKAAESLSGVVLAPDGAPAPGVSVAASGNGSRGYVSLNGSRLRSYDSRGKVAMTDDQGRFKLATLPDSDQGFLVAAGEAGFARIPLAEARDEMTVPLQRWGRIEGTLKSGGQPAAGKDLLFNLNLPGVGLDFNAYKVTTDEQGRFTMENVPPGEGSIVRLIQTSPNSWSHSDNTLVQVKPGETTQVALGDNGALITGRYRYSFQPTNESPLQLQGYLSGTMPPAPRFGSQEEAQAFFQSPEWQAAMKLHKNYTVELKPDGSFTVDNVVPGAYSLNLSARVGGEQSWQNPPVAQGSAQITVPDSFNPAQPIDAGEVLLNPVPPPAQPPETGWH